MVVTTQSNIQEFFKNKTIFITGGTGFLGKLIVNKLIRSCPQIKRIYMLVREKKGKTPNERLKDIFNLPVRKLLYLFFLHIIFRKYVIINIIF